MMAKLDMKWEMVVGVLPFLRVLDPLPRFSVALTGVAIVIVLVFWSILRCDTGDDDGGLTSPSPKREDTPSSTEQPATTEQPAPTTKEHIE